MKDALIYLFDGVWVKASTIKTVRGNEYANTPGCYLLVETDNDKYKAHFDTKTSMAERREAIIMQVNTTLKA